MIRSFLKMYGLDPGVDTRNLVTMRVTLPEQRYKTPESRITFQERLLPRLAAIPGVESASLTSSVPLGGGDIRQFELEGQAPMDPEKLPRLARLVVTPEYFQTVKARIVRGRSFEESDGAPGKANVIVNSSFASKYWPGEDPLGKRFRLTGQGEQPWLTVVGVSPEITQIDPSHTEPNNVIYAPYRLDPLRGTAILARTRVPPESLIEAFRKEVRAVDEDLPVFDAKSMQQVLIDQRWTFRVFGTLFAIFAGIGLTLSAVGIYAVVAYSVTRRTQEIGVRMALGASKGSVLRLILSLGFAQLAIGLTIGLAASYGLTRVLKSLLVQVSPTDPVTFTAISALLLLIGGFACWMPAQKAAKIDPMIALRYE
jgi:putative ABC transport system permease protein